MFVGEWYVGEWKDGNYHGQGTFTSPVGDKYVGEFKNGKLWDGKIDDKNGNLTEKVVNGEWIER